MSLRAEQYRSLFLAKELLYSLFTRKDWTRKTLRQEAKRALRHYPPLSKKGEPLFSQDPFPCFDIKEDETL